MRLLFSDASRLDLIQIGDFIANDSPVRALTFIDELEHCCAGLMEIPFRFGLAPGHDSSGLRRRVFGSYLIFYLVDSEAVTIVRIINSARDYDAILVPDA